MEVNCKACNKLIKIKPSHVNPDGNYCSKECWYASGSPRPKRMTGVTKICEVCGKEFYVQANRVDKVKHCSRECKGVASRMPKKICEVCGKEWQPRCGQGDRPCCSKECGAIYRRNGEMVPCQLCGKEIYITRSRRAIGQDFFCSKEHADEWARRNKTIHTCKICSKIFRWSPSRSKTYNIKYCSQACRDADPETRARLIAMNVLQQRKYPTRPESIGYELLSSLGVEYLPQHLIGEKFCVDAFIPGLGIVVQFDGDYWHGNPAFFPVLDTRQRKRARLDASQDAYMAACGYAVVRIWASDLETHPEQVKMHLQSVFSARLVHHRE